MAPGEQIDEKALNADIARVMEKQAPPDFTVGAEIHGQAKFGQTSPDLVIKMPYDLRMIVEAEYDVPALCDAIKRLGYEFHDHSRDVENVIALGIPRKLGSPTMGHDEREAELLSDEPQFMMQVVTGKSPKDPDIIITPENPVPVSLRDVIQYAWLAAIPESYTAEVLSKVITELRAARNELARLLKAKCDSEDFLILENAFGFKYGNPDSESPSESAAGNIVGTLVSMIELHRNLKRWGRLPGVLPIDSPDLWNESTGEGIPSRIAIQWHKIEAEDFKPLSTIAADMLEDGELSPYLGGTLKTVRATIEGYIEAGLSATTNVAAAVWQELTPDRDERAVNYTRPHRAEFLANMTTTRLRRPAKARYMEVCAGTGTLARATEENIRFRHYAQTKDKSSIHAERMQSCIQLTDISQQSISVATANLISLEPQTKFDDSAIFAITASGGSLNLLGPDGVGSMEARLIGSYGEKAATLTIDPGTVGICCNNDPYFRSRGGAKNPISSKDMRKYKRQADSRIKGVANGQAGLATFMHVIEHEMLARGAPHGKVLPLTAAHAKTYQGFRRNIEDDYNNVIAISTSAGKGESMSDDTDIQEMLLVGTKQRKGGGSRSLVCVNLTDDFQTKLEAKMYADAIRREIQHGKPFGEISVGRVVGTYNRMDNLGDGRPWSSLGTSGRYTRLTEYVTQGVAWNPVTGSETEFALPMTTLSLVSDIGPTHDLLGCLPASRDPRGAFVMIPATDTNDRINPSLWKADYKTQISITCQPTHFGIPRSDATEVSRMLTTAGHFHLSRNLRQSAQNIAMGYTESECMGGRSWTTIKAPVDVARAIALFLNSTFGMLIRIGYGQSTDIGRSSIQVRAIHGHPIPDFAVSTSAGANARAIAFDNFDALRKLSLKRISLSAVDPSRAKIDEVVAKILGIEWNLETENMLAAWRNLMCQQTMVHNNTKKTLDELRRAGVMQS